MPQIVIKLTTNFWRLEPETYLSNLRSENSFGVRTQKNRKVIYIESNSDRSLVIPINSATLGESLIVSRLLKV